VGQTVRQRARRQWEEDEEKVGRVNDVKEGLWDERGGREKSVDGPFLEMLQLILLQPAVN
jgi:hypothetical protein